MVFGGIRTVMNFQASTTEAAAWVFPGKEELYGLVTHGTHEKLFWSTGDYAEE